MSRLAEGAVAWQPLGDTGFQGTAAVWVSSPGAALRAAKQTDPLVAFPEGRQDHDTYLDFVVLPSHRRWPLLFQNSSLVCFSGFHVGAGMAGEGRDLQSSWGRREVHRPSPADVWGSVVIFIFPASDFITNVD